LGAFVNTGKRILFFPGLTDRRTVSSSEGGEFLEKGIVHNTDHINLENNLRNFHITLDEKATQGTKYRTMKTVSVKDNMFLWFVMGIKNSNMLQLAPKTQEIKIRWDNYSDLKRRASIIENSRGDCLFNVTRIDDELPDPYYINFEFFVSNIQSKEYEPPLETYTLNLSSYDANQKDVRSQVHTRSHYVILRGFNGSAWVRVSKITGRLNNHAVFMYR
jgi:hypothetical protein